MSRVVDLTLYEGKYDSFSDKEKQQVKEIKDLAYGEACHFICNSHKKKSQITIWQWHDNHEMKEPLTLILYRGDSNDYMLTSLKD